MSTYSAALDALAEKITRLEAVEREHKIFMEMIDYCASYYEAQTEVVIRISHKAYTEGKGWKEILELARKESNET